MIKHLLPELADLRAAKALVWAIPFLIGTVAYAQDPSAAGSPATQLTEAAPGPAAPPAPASQGEASTERVVVTGSYIPTAEEVTASPLDTLTTQELRRAGTSDVLTVLQKRNPDFVGAANLGNTNANITSGATLGGGIVSIRGFPTLVLFKNRRIADSAAIATGGFQFSDVNLFPTALISRIEVLKDGASALYGSDAVGGVVNIFMKEDYQGAEIGARYGFSVESGVAERRAYVIGGVGNETTHVTAGFQYLEEDGLFQRERAYSQLPPQGSTITFGGVGLDDSSFYLLKGTDPNKPFGPFALNSPFDAPGVVPGGVAPLPENAGYGQLPQAYDPTSSATVAGYNLFQVPTSTLDISNTNAYMAGTHQIFGKELEIFGDFLYSKNHNENYLNAQPINNASVSPTGGLLILGSVRVDPNDPTGSTLIPEDRGAPAPFNPFQLSIDSNTLSGPYSLYAFNRYQEAAPRRFLNDTNFYRFLLGLRSEFAKNWTAETAAYYSHYSIDFVNTGLVRADQLNAMIAGTAIDNNGNPIPALDFFAHNPIGTGPGQVTPAQFATAFGNNIRKQDSFQEVFDGRVTGLPFNLPGGPVGIALGGEYREEGFKLKDSPEIFIGSVPVQEINASRSVYSFFAELSIPIVGSAQKVPGIYSLELSLAGRYDHYEGVKEDAKVPKIALRYQPIKDLTLRATYSNSFVAPNLFQLVGPAGTGFSPTISLINPATGESEQQNTQAQVLGGSNPDLVPSTAESYTAGIVYSPSFVPGLTITADYFRTLQQQIVGILGGASILNSVNNSGPASPYADLVAFGNFPGQQGSRPVTAPGQLFGNLINVYYIDTFRNIGAARAEGFDLAARYNLDLQKWGQLELGANAVVFTKSDLKRTAQSHYYNINGLDFAEGGGGNPEYKLTFLAEYRWQGATLSLNANYIPELRNSVSDDPETVDQNALDVIDDYFSVDGRLSYTFVRKAPEVASTAGYSKDGKSSVDKNAVATSAGTLGVVDRILDGLTLTVGCNNIFDETPPYVAGANSATDLSLYDPFGRFVYFEVSKKF